MSNIKHLCYEIEQAGKLNHFQEILWKRIAFDFLLKHEPHLEGLSSLDHGCDHGETMELVNEREIVLKGTDCTRRRTFRSAVSVPSPISTSGRRNRTGVIDSFRFQNLRSLVMY
jgi:hypothetical protein